MKRKKIIISIILILGGIILIVYPKISNYFIQKNQNEIIKVYKEEILSKEEKEIEEKFEEAYLYNKSLIDNSKIEKQYKEILNIDKNGVMAYIEIPKISLYLPIYHGTDKETLKKGIGHLENSSFPIGTKDSHSILTGHTGMKIAKLFTRLTELKKDDYFYIYVLNKKLKYKIYEIKTILPDETNELQIKENKDLVTLITCTPYGINTHRLLVMGEREENIEYINEYESKDNEEEIQENFCCILLKKIVKYIKKVRRKR